MVTRTSDTPTLEPALTLAATRRRTIRRGPRIPPRRLLIRLIPLRAQPNTNTNNSIAPKVISRRVVSHTLRPRRRDTPQISKQATKEATKDTSSHSKISPRMAGKATQATLAHLVVLEDTPPHNMERQEDTKAVDKPIMGLRNSTIIPTVRLHTVGTTRLNTMAAISFTKAASSTAEAIIDL